MASSHGGLEENLKCSICLEIFKDPVVLQCSHSFCKDCLEENWNRKSKKDCPLCRTAAKRTFKSLALKEICESYVEEKRRRTSELNQGTVCMVHGKKHKLFCVEDKKMVCSSCVDEDHNDHNFCSISKAAEDHRKELQGPLQELKNKVESLISKRKFCASRSTELQAQTQQHECHIKAEIEKLHQFLREEEKARITALREEEQQKKKTLAEKTAEIEKLIADLSERIHQIEGGEDSLFLHNFREINQRALLPVSEPQLNAGPLIDVAKHLGNLRYRVWHKMKDFSPYYPVILQPNAQTTLQVSQDLTTITYAPQPDSPTIPVKNLRCILGSEGFSSGVHTWQVQVESCDQWILGIVKESDRRTAFPSNCSYSVFIINGKCSWSPEVPTIKKVCVLLDMQNGQVKFTDPDTNTTLKMFSGEFTEKMYPCFLTFGKSSMRILPAKVW